MQMYLRVRNYYYITYIVITQYSNIDLDAVLKVYSHYIKVVQVYKCWTILSIFKNKSLFIAINYKLSHTVYLQMVFQYCRNIYKRKHSLKKKRGQSIKSLVDRCGTMGQDGNKTAGETVLYTLSFCIFDNKTNTIYTN